MNFLNSKFISRKSQKTKLRSRNKKIIKMSFNIKVNLADKFKGLPIERNNKKAKVTLSI